MSFKTEIKEIKERKHESKNERLKSMDDAQEKSDLKQGIQQVAKKGKEKKI